MPTAVATFEQLYQQVAAPILAVDAAALPVAPAEATLVALPMPARRLIDEKVRFADAVWRAARDNRISEELAVAVVARRDAELFPVLSKAGKRAASMLTYRAYREIVKALGRDRQGRPVATPAAKLCLVRDYHNGTRPRPGHERWWELFLADFLTLRAPPLTTSYELACITYRQTVEQAGRLVADGDIPERHQVDYHMKHVYAKDKLALARKGPTWMENNVLDYRSRDWGSVPVNQCWVGDNRQVDWFVRVHDATAKCGWRAVRPYVSLFIDGRSRAVLGFAIKIGAHNRITILQTLHGCIQAAGNSPPEVIYVDNGADFKAAGFLSPAVIEGHEHGVALALGCRVVFAIPYNAKAKLAEGFYRFMAMAFDRLMPSYSGRSPERKPGSLGYWEANPDKLPTIEEAEEFLRWWITHYNRRPSRARHMRGLTPQSLQEAALRDPLRPPLSPDELRAACRMPYPTARTIQRGGRVTLGGLQYRAIEARTAAWIGRKALVLIDTFSPETVALCAPDGTLIGEASRVKLLHPLLGAEAAGKATAHERRWLSAQKVSLAIDKGDAPELNPAARMALLEPGRPRPDLPPPGPVAPPARVEPVRISEDMAAMFDAVVYGEDAAAPAVVTRHTEDQGQDVWATLDAIDAAGSP